MKILVADDNDEKLQFILDLLREHFTDVDLTWTKAVNTTFRELISTKYDLCLLDMTMPTFEVALGEDLDRNLKTLAGKEVIGKLAYREIYVPIIVITAFEVFGRHDNLKHMRTVYKELAEEFPEIVRGFVFFDIQSESWKDDLIKQIKDVSRV